MIVGDTPPVQMEARVHNFPPPPHKLYHGNHTLVNQQEKGLAISFVKIKYKQNFSKLKNRGVIQGIDFQNLLDALQKDDETLMICMLSPSPNGSRNYID